MSAIDPVIDPVAQFRARGYVVLDDSSRDAFLRLLAEDAEGRARFVAALHHSASILDGGSERPSALGEVLRDAAQRLCDHARTSADGRCRYCWAPMGDGA